MPHSHPRPRQAESRAPCAGQCLEQGRCRGSSKCRDYILCPEPTCQDLGTALVVTLADSHQPLTQWRLALRCRQRGGAHLQSRCCTRRRNKLSVNILSLEAPRQPLCSVLAAFTVSAWPLKTYKWLQCVVEKFPRAGQTISRTKSVVPGAGDRELAGGAHVEPVLLRVSAPPSGEACARLGCPKPHPQGQVRSEARPPGRGRSAVPTSCCPRVLH